MQPNVHWTIFAGSLACLGLAIYGYQHRGVKISALENEAGRLEADDAEQLGRLRTELAAARKTLNSMPQSARNQAPRRTTPNTAVEDHFRSLRKDPVFAALWHKRQLRTVQRLFGDTIADMKLPAGDANKLRELIIARTNAQVDSRDVARESGLSPEEANVAVAQATGEINAEIKTLIGDSNFAALQKPPIGLLKPFIENSVGEDLDMMGSPLTPAQTTVLAQAFSPIFTPGPAPSGAGQKPDSQTGLTPFYQTMLDRVTPNLTPEQIPAVKDYLVERMEEQQYAAKTMTASNHTP